MRIHFYRKKNNIWSLANELRYASEKSAVLFLLSTAMQIFCPSWLYFLYLHQF